MVEIQHLPQEIQITMGDDIPEDVEREDGVVVESVTVTGAVVEGASDGMDTGINIEATSMGE